MMVSTTVLMSSGLKARNMRSTTTGMGGVAPIRSTRQRSVAPRRRTTRQRSVAPSSGLDAWAVWRVSYKQLNKYAHWVKTVCSSYLQKHCYQYTNVTYHHTSSSTCRHARTVDAIEWCTGWVDATTGCSSSSLGLGWGKQKWSSFTTVWDHHVPWEQTYMMIKYILVLL